MFKTAFMESFDKKFPERLSVFKDANYRALTELSELVFEINKCIIVELHNAAITLTNHFLERLLKLALIYNEVGVGPIPLEHWNDTFGEANKKYSSISLSIAINKCEEYSLIMPAEKKFLHEIIRVQLRNGFSHADPGMILKNIPRENTFFQGSFSTPNELTPIKMNQTDIPVFQSILIRNFAKNNAEYYFDQVFELSKRIENRLLEKFETIE